MKQRQSGLSLIQLMLVLALIGIVVAMIVPHVKARWARNQTSEAYDVLTHAKLTVAQYQAQQHVLPADAKVAGIPAGASTYLSALTLKSEQAQGSVTISGTLQNVNNRIEGKTLALHGTFSADQKWHWHCTSTVDIAWQNYLPDVCRIPL